MENPQRQQDELEALASIYGDDFSVVDAANKVYVIKLYASQTQHKQEVVLRFTLPSSYPNDGPPIYEINAPWLKGIARSGICDSLEEIYLENMGEDIIFMWSEKIREQLSDLEAESETDVSEMSLTHEDKSMKILAAHEDKIGCPEIFHGEPIIDRKSTFQAHVAKVFSVEEVSKVRRTLLGNKKIAHATHNILAYRIVDKKGSVIQDCDDDGENAAGGRLLHLLNIISLENVAVIVTRWYGGIHLGPDRFKHINNAARSALEQHGLLKNAKAK